MPADKTNLLASPSGRLIRRLGITLMAGAVLTGFYSVYAMVLRPVVVPPGMAQPVPTDRLWAPPRPRQGEEMAKRYLVSQPWAAKAKYILRTDEAFIYFEEWDPLDEDEAVRFTPFAMVWTKKDRKPDEEPITIISDSAYVRFAKKFRLSSPNAGRIIGGALEGAVHIHGNNNMQIAGRNFVFSEQLMRVWSDNHVDFAYGPHRGNGHSLQMDLIPDEAARAKEKLAVKGFKNIRLRRNVSMDLEFRDGEADSFTAQAEPTKQTDPPKQNEPLQNVPDSKVALKAPPVDPFAVDAPADKKSKKPNSKSKSKPKPPTIVKVRSAGSFEYVVATNVATFEDEVRVYQPTEPGKFNSLQSDLMTLYFEPNEDPKALKNAAVEAAAPPKVEEEESFKTVDSNLTFRRLVALGQNVILRSETNELIAMMHRLDYDAKNRLAKMSSRDAVRVLQKQSEMQCPQIDLLHKERGEVSHLWARGAGWLQNLDEKTRKIVFAAQWKKELRKLPDPRTGLDLIELESEALVRQPEDKFGLAAEFMRVWLAQAEETKSEKTKPDKPGADEEPLDPNQPLIQNVSANSIDPDHQKPKAKGDKEKDKKESDRSNRMRPKRLLALKNVAIVSPDMQGQAKRLEVWFEPAPVIPSPQTDGPPEKQSRARLVPAVKQIPAQTVSTNPAQQQVALGASGSGSPIKIPLAPPADDEARSAADENSSTKTGKKDKSPKKKPKEDGPIEVVSDLIRVKVLTYADRRKSEVSEVWTEGSVVVRQMHAPKELPLHMTGDKLHVLNRSRDNQVMTLWGSPAHVRDRGSHIEGREIFLDRMQNQSRVNGAGLLQLPVNRSLDGQELKEAKLLDVWWSEEMTFDGLNANFFGNVRAVLNNDGLRSNMRCEEMEVVLSEKISFIDSQSDRAKGETKAEVSRVFCKDGVEFDSYKYAESKLTEVRRGRFAEFEINQTTGDTSGQGPGWIKVWRRGRGKRAALTPNASVKANRALKPDASKWEYMRIDFAGTADGNLKQKFNTFKDRVQIIYGPVERSLMVIKLEDLPKDAGWMRCQSLRITQNEAKGKDQTGYIDLLALGNVELEGRSFNARAESISYDESKGLYTLRSQGRRKATIWRQLQVGGKLSRADAQLMYFIPARNVLKLDQAVGLEGVN